MSYPKKQPSKIDIDSLSIPNILLEANKLGLLVEAQNTSLAFHKYVNQALLVIHALDPCSLNNVYKDNNGTHLTIDSLNRLTKIPPLALSRVLEELIKLEIVQMNNGYYSLIPL